MGKERVGGFCWFLLSSIHCSFRCMPKGQGERGLARVRLGCGLGRIQSRCAGNFWGRCTEPSLRSRCPPGAPWQTGGFRAEVRSSQAISRLNPHPHGLLRSTLPGPDLFSFRSSGTAVKYAIEA